MKTHGAEGVLLTGVYGSGKSSVAAELAYLLEQRGERYALPDLDYLSWAGTGTDDRAAEFVRQHRGVLPDQIAVDDWLACASPRGCSCPRRRPGHNPQYVPAGPG